MLSLPGFYPASASLLIAKAFQSAHGPWVSVGPWWVWMACRHTQTRASDRARGTQCLHYKVCKARSTQVQVAKKGCESARTTQHSAYGSYLLLLRPRLRPLRLYFCCACFSAFSAWQRHDASLLVSGGPCRSEVLLSIEEVISGGLWWASQFN